MRKPIEHCPACDGDLIITQQSCIECNTSIVGQFKPNIFSKLSPESLAFVELFVKNKGNVKEMEREVGESYWTIRNRINDVIAELGFEGKEEEDVPSEEDGRFQRQEILAMLDNGDLTVDEAADLLKQISTSN
ncbi:MAG: DUF2089 domain-containing protein [Chloroflexi bacterium]|nr:DUF2089 domain-containing protein [Chloroflexota bacterium]